MMRLAGAAVSTDAATSIDTGFECCPVSSGQTQGGSEPTNRLPLWSPARPALEVADPTHAQPGALRQRLLRQSGRSAMPTEDRPEVWETLPLR
jgi:hypothetical protein